MTRLLMCGWESGLLEEDLGTTYLVATFNNPQVSVQGTGGRSGTYYMRCLLDTTTAARLGTAARRYTLSGNPTEGWARFGFYTPTLNNNEGGPIVFFRIYGDSLAEQFRLHIGYADRIIRLANAANTTLASSASATNGDAWNLIQVRWQFTSTTAGVVEVYLNNVQVINYSGDVVSASNTNVVTLELCFDRTAVTNTTGGTNSFYGFDDFAVNNTSGTLNNGKPLDARITMIRPNGAGTSATWSRGGTDSGSNWGQVDETPMTGATDYVQASAVADRDLYALANLPSDAGSVVAVQTVYYAQNSAGGGDALAPTLKSSATTTEGTAQTLPVGYGILQQIWETDPNTSAAWTVPAVNALEGGFTAR